MFIRHAQYYHLTSLHASCERTQVARQLTTSLTLCYYQATICRSLHDDNVHLRARSLLIGSGINSDAIIAKNASVVTIVVSPRMNLLQEQQLRRCCIVLHHAIRGIACTEATVGQSAQVVPLIRPLQ